MGATKHGTKKPVMVGSLGGRIEKAQGFCPVLFTYWYATKPAIPFTKIYSVLRCSNFFAFG